MACVSWSLLQNQAGPGASQSDLEISVIRSGDGNDDRDGAVRVLGRVGPGGGRRPCAGWPGALAGPIGVRHTHELVCRMRVARGLLLKQNTAPINVIGCVREICRGVATGPRMGWRWREPECEPECGPEEPKASARTSRAARAQSIGTRNCAAQSTGGGARAHCQKSMRPNYV